MNLRIDLPPVAPSVATARHFVRETASEWGVPPSSQDVAEVLVSELAANAIVHAATGFSVVASLDGGALRVAVEDGCPAVPVLLEAPPESDRGRGLAIIDGLASSWGVEPRGEGKCVWFAVAPVGG